MGQTEARRADRAIEAIVEWAKARRDIRGIALVGSRASGKARPGSDIDLVLLTANPDKFRSDQSWIGAIDWAGIAVGDPTWGDEDYEKIWSRRIWIGGGVELEMSFAALSWASTAPLDPGTRRVISDGCRILYDPDGSLDLLCKAVYGSIASQTGKASLAASVKWLGS